MIMAVVNPTIAKRMAAVIMRNTGQAILNANSHSKH